ncbi:hypothetical protein MKX54_20095 [Alkalihalobacillus sp. FSL R5-0424]
MLLDMLMLLNVENSDLYQSGQGLLRWVQGFGILVAAGGFIVGAYFLMAGGARGRMSCIGWFLGAAAGLMILLGAYDIVDAISDNAQFSN